jgi:hypothetical protein
MADRPWRVMDCNREVGAMVRFWLLALLLAAPPGARAAASVCIQSYRIDHTEVPDDSQILFHMRDHSVYQAKIERGCVGLHLDPRGFTYAPNPGTDEICSNLLTIRLNSSGIVCLVGELTRIVPPK